MESKPPDRQIPLRMLDEVRRLEINGLIALHGERFSEAKEFFEKEYHLFFDAQSVENRPIHKGAPLHNLGLVFFYLGEVDKSVRHFLLAYVEDTLNAGYDQEDEADRSPAAVMLRDVFLIRLKILSEIKSASLKIKQEGHWNEARDPGEILRNVVTKLGFNIDQLSRLCGRIPEKGKMVVGFPQPKELRVFIGTNYDVNIGVIPLVKEGVTLKNLATGRGYVPITVLDVIVPPNATHDVSLLLLHTCGYAIVDVSHPGGQYVEIERIRDYGIAPSNVLLVRQATKPIDPEHPPHVSEMVSTLGYNIKYYFDPRELIAITQAFLP